MKSRSSFRTVDEWRSALMTLPDNGFFELLRSVFGNIKTPFNKQKLMDDLFKLLSRDDIRKTIMAYINEQDHKIIAAVALLDEPVSGELESFFAGEFSNTELHSLVLNLEERLILYRFKGADNDNLHPGGRVPPSAEGVLRLALNPVLEKILEPFASDIKPLFPSTNLSTQASGKKTDSKADNKPDSPCAGFIDARILAALFAFLYGYSEEELLKNDTETQLRGLRKKAHDEGKKIFPDLDLELAVRTLLHLELFRTEGCSLVPNGEKIADFSELSPLERQGYWAAGVYFCLNEATASDASSPNPSGYEAGILQRNRLRKIVSTIHRFMCRIEAGKKYPEVTLRRLMELIWKEDGGLGNVWGVRLFDDRIRLPFESFLAAIERAGLLEKKENGWKVAGTNAAPKGKDKDEAIPVIVMDTAFSFILYPEISFADAMTLAAFCTVKAPAAGNHRPDGTAVCFELTRESAVRGFDQGMEAAGMLELLSRLSHNRLDENLGWTLKDWENRYAGVSLHHGIVLNLAEDRRYLAEARPLAYLIRRTLAPGVYLLSSGDRTEAIKALRKAGVDIIAQPPPVDRKSQSGWAAASGYLRNSFPRLGSFETAGLPKVTEMQEKAADGNAESESIKQKFRQILGKMRLGKPERDELEARIERRLILSETQLEATSLKYEKLEARGLDYSGKTTIAKQAIEAGSLLEVSWSGPGGSIKQALGAPLALEKKEGDSILVIKAPAAGTTVETAPLQTLSGNTAAQETIRIPLGKISHLRRIKQSIFGG